MGRKLPAIANNRESLKNCGSYMGDTVLEAYTPEMVSKIVRLTIRQLQDILIRNVL
jgi:hypothetical protein